MSQQEFKLVPVKPTDEMLAAVQAKGGLIARSYAYASWDDMLANGPAAVDDRCRDAVMEAIGGALGEAYDCTRTWTAWGCGTMGPSDFSLVAEQGDRLAEIADAAIAAISPTMPEAVEAAHLMGHASFADMVSGHIGVWREALGHMLTNKGYDRAYVERELKALVEIQAACKVEQSA